MSEYPDFVMSLGTFNFYDFEVPEHIEGIIEQVVVLHKYPGGSRTVDAMGPQRGKFSFAGKLMGVAAETRRNDLEDLAAAGLPIMLSYSQRILSVIIVNCHTSFRRFWEVDYTLELEVVDDLVQALPALASSLDDVIAADLNDAATDATVLADIAFTAALALVNLGPGALASYAAASVRELAVQVAAIGAAQALGVGLSAAAEVGLAGAGAPALFASGVDPALMAVSVGALSSAAIMLPTALGATNSLGRAQKNASSIGA